jgi:hypothetical protein
VRTCGKQTLSRHHEAAHWENCVTQLQRPEPPVYDPRDKPPPRQPPSIDEPPPVEEPPQKEPPKPPYDPDAPVKEPPKRKH